MDLTMKIPILLLIIASIGAGIAAAANLASAPSYGLLFMIGVVAGAVSLCCTIFLYRTGLRWLFAGLLPGGVALYSIVDIALRYFAGVRLLDMFSR
jgi:hypothetical protein